MKIGTATATPSLRLVCGALGAAAVLGAGGLGGSSTDAQQPPRDTRPTPGAATARIAGRVVAVDTGRGLSRARVSISGEGLDKSRAVQTDRSGRFELDGLPPGSFTLHASRPPYVGAAWGQKRAFGTGKRLEVRAGQHLEGIEIALAAGAVLSGRVVDEHGEPVAATRVQAERFTFEAGSRKLRPVGADLTDDLGQYRIHGLPAGQYFLVAARQSNFAGWERNETREDFAPTYFPSTLDPGAAQRVRVQRGQEAGSLTIALQTTRMVRISGTIVTSEGRAVADASLMVQDPGNPYTFHWGGPVLAGGVFEIDKVTAGTRVLVAQAQVNGRSERASQTIAVTGETDVTGVTLVLQPEVTLRGQVIFDGSSGGPPPRDVSISAQPEPDEPGAPMAHANSRMRDDGTFELGVTPGMRTTIVAFAGSSPAWQLRSVLHGSADITDQVVEFRSNDQGSMLLVTLTDRTSGIEGQVTDASGGTVKDYVALVFPDTGPLPARLRGRNTAPSDQQGRYGFRGLPPGTYIAVAVEDLEPGAAFDPETLESLRPYGTTVTLAEGERKVVPLKLAAVE